MRDKKRMNLFLGIGVTFLVCFLVGICFLSVRVMNSKKQIVLPETTQTTTNETTQSEQTTNSMKEITKNSELEEFLETYFTWELTEKSVSDRAIKLENMMSATCYDLTEIQLDKEQLTKMIQKYEKTKEIIKPAEKSSATFFPDCPAFVGLFNSFSRLARLISPFIPPPIR